MPAAEDPPRYVVIGPLVMVPAGRAGTRTRFTGIASGGILPPGVPAAQIESMLRKGLVQRAVSDAVTYAG